MAHRKKRRSAWGSITQTDSTTWRIRYWAKGHDGQYRRRSETVRGTRLDAERRRSELMLDHSDDAPCPTVRQIWERWVQPDMERRVERGDMSKRSLGQYSSAWRNHVEPTWGDVDCDAVRPLRVQQWIDTLGRSQASQGVKVLSKVMDYAVRYEKADHNPMRERYVMPSASTVARMDAGIWTAEQLVEEWNSLRGEWYEPAFILSAFGGLRVGESLGVTAEDVLVQEIAGVPTAVVRVTSQVDSDGEVHDRLKTASSTRLAVIVGPPASRLEELMPTSADWYLTNDGMGGPQPQYRLRKAWHGSHPFRNLRNSFETWMRYDLRAPRWLIERLMGHSAGDVSDRYYDRPDDSRLGAVMADLYRERPIWDFAIE